jgi:outer membrane protein
MSYPPQLLKRSLAAEMYRKHRYAGRVLLARCSPILIISLAVMPIMFLSQAAAQTTPESAEAKGVSRVELGQQLTPDRTAPPLAITLQDAIDRARKNDTQFLAARVEAKFFHEDHVQARNAMLPNVSATTQYLNTQGNGGKTPNGRFVTNDGVHVYRAWGVFHQDLSPNTYTMTGYHRTAAAEAIGRAKEEIARRGLTVTVTKLYYTLAVSQHKYATAQQTLEQAKYFYDIAQHAEQLGQGAHADVIKAEIQYQQQQQGFEETRLAMENARLDLAVLLFPTLNENFTVVDDLASSSELPAFREVRHMAEKENPELRVAAESVRQANLEVFAAKAAFLPTILLDVDYGIEANDFALRSVAKADPLKGPLPNLGYFAQASLSIPVWDWGTLRSKLHQSKYKDDLAHAEMSQAQRTMLKNLYSLYNEASVARSAFETTRHTANLASESLRLVGLRYQAGESPMLEVVDAQNTLVLARNAYDDAGLRYRVALANLQTLTGSF